MALPRDEDTLRIPAYRRKRSLSARQRRPLLLTALDRKNAGVAVPGIAKPKAKKTPSTKRKKTSRIKQIQAPTQTFSAPFFDFETPSAPKKNKPIGTITHYYHKIQVAVMKVSSTISVGDFIRYETEDGPPYTQIVESMEIDRTPVFKAGRGKEIGLKILKIPRIGTLVYAE